MSKTNTSKPLISLFEIFIKDTEKGKRLQKNGSLVSKGRIENYYAVLINLKRFAAASKQDLLFNINYSYSKINFNKEKKYYNQFYKQYTDFLYRHGCTDNYVGLQIKILRTFFIYLDTAKGYNTGGFYKEFYVRKEETPVIVLSREQLQFLINNKNFDEQLPYHIKTSKDIFVVGCSIGLRVSDLMALKQKNIEKQGDAIYIINKSRKTGTHTRIKLPPYVVDILATYKGMQKTILPSLSLNQFNKNLKTMAELAGWTYEISKERSKRGQRKEMKKSNGSVYRFCDIISSHIMRKTAITTMLMLGMPEPLVRKVSGHAANSKEFYKYVRYSEAFLDHETDKVFQKLMPY